MRPLFASAAPAVLAAAACLLVPGAAQSQPAAPAAPVAPVAPAAPGAGPSAPAAQVEEAVARVQKFYDGTTTFQSDFVQEFVVKAYNTKKASAGTVTFSKPGKMDWVYKTPKDNRVVSDGAELKVYDASNKQLFQQQVTKSQYPAALAFLTGQGKLGEHFAFELFQGDKMNFPGGFVLVGTPKQAHPAYTKVLFYVDNATAQVRRVMIIDGQGNRNRFDFTTPRVNLEVKADRFTFTPPPGTTIVKP